MANDVIAIFGITKCVSQIAGAISGGLILNIRVPCGIAGEPFVHSAGGMLIPATDMPRILSLAHSQLSDFSSRGITGSVLFAINNIMNARAGHAAVVEPSNGRGIIAFDVMDHVKFVAVTRGVIVGIAKGMPDGRTVIGTG